VQECGPAAVAVVAAAVALVAAVIGAMVVAVIGGGDWRRWT